MSNNRFSLKIKPFIIILIAVAAVAVALAVGLYFYIGHSVSSDGPTETLADKFRLGGSVTVNEIRDDQDYKYGWLDSALVNIFTVDSNGVYNESDDILSFDDSTRTFTVRGIGAGKLEFYNAVDHTVKFEFPYTAFCRNDTEKLLKSNYPAFYSDGIVSATELDTVTELTVNTDNTEISDVTDFGICKNLDRILIPSEAVAELKGIDGIDVTVYVNSKVYADYGESAAWRDLFDRVYPLVSLDRNLCTIVFGFAGGDMEGVAIGSEMYFTALDRGDRLAVEDYPMSRLGYTFVGWTADGNTPLESDTAITKNIKLAALWRVNRYTVEYVSDHVSNVPAPITAEYEKAFSVAANASQRVGYTFAGWTARRGSTDILFRAGDNAVNLTAEDGATVKLYDIWTANKYRVEFDGNGGGEMPSGFELTYDSTTNFSVMPSRTGYDFIGFAFDKDAVDPDYAPTDSFLNLTATAGETVTLFAVWNAHKYNVEYVSMISQASSPEGHGAEYDKPFELPALDVIREGYTFVGWAEDGSSEILRVGNSAINLTSDDGVTVTLFDVWTVNRYTIVFDANGGSAAPDALDNVEYDSEITLPTVTPLRNGYTFIGWSESESGTTADFAAGEKLKNLVTQNGTVVLYALWVVNVYEVWFDINDGIGAQSVCVRDISYERTLMIPNTGYSRIGYELAGWSLDCYAVNADYTSEIRIKDVAGESEKIILYAVWVGHKYTIRFDMNGGGTPYNDLAMTYGRSVTFSVMPSRTGYAFKGWSLVKNSGNIDFAPSTLFKDLTDEDGAIVTLYAVWTANTYSLEYDLNGGNGLFKKIADIPYDTNFVITADEPTRYGYTFAGWSMQRNGTPTYKKGMVVKNLTSANAVTVTLYAVWNAETFTIKYDANGGENPPAESRYLSYGSASTAFTKTSPTRFEHKFVGWSFNKRTAAHSTASDCNFFTNDTLTAAQVNSMYEKASGGSVTLYAVWDINTHVVYVQSGGNKGGSISISNGTVFDYGAYVSFNVSYSGGKNQVLYIDGRNVGNPASYWFTMPEHDVTVKVSSDKKCFAAGTLILLADGSSKKVEELTGREKILSWDFEAGKMIETSIALINSHGEDDYDVMTVLFDDGTSVDIIGEHGFFDKTLGEFVYLTEYNVDRYIGHSFVKTDGQTITSVTLIAATVEERHTTSYSVWAAKGLTCFAEGMLTVGPSGYMFGFGLFDIVDMKYDETEIEKAVAEYGLYTYDDWSDYVTYEQYVAFNGKFLKITEGMGLATKQEIVEMIKRTLERN